MLDIIGLRFFFFFLMFQVYGNWRAALSHGTYILYAPRSLLSDETCQELRETMSTFTFAPLTRSFNLKILIPTQWTALNKPWGYNTAGSPCLIGHFLPCRSIVDEWLAERTICSFYYGYSMLFFSLSHEWMSILFILSVHGIEFLMQSRMSFDREKCSKSHLPTLWRKKKTSLYVSYKRW